MSTLDHPNILKYIDISSKTNNITTIFEYPGSNDLQKFFAGRKELQKENPHPFLSEVQFFDIVCQIALALENS